MRNLQAATPKKDDNNSSDECNKNWSSLLKAIKSKETKRAFWSNQNTLLKETCASKKASKRILFKKRVLQAVTPKDDTKNDAELAGHMN